MQRDQTITPVFYTRCVDAPYTEGHIQVIRMMVKSLLLCNVKSIIFNFRYAVSQSIEDRQVSEHRIEQTIPLVTRDSMYRFSPPLAAYALSMETIGTLRFLLLEKILKNRKCVVNIVNCSRYPRTLLRRMSRAPIVLHFYMPNIRLRLLTRAFADKANMIMASSYAVSHYLQDIGIDKEKIRVVYPPVDTELYKPMRKTRARSELGLPAKGKTIVYIGGLNRFRFPEDMVLDVLGKTVKQVPGVHLAVYTPRDNNNVKRSAEIIRKMRSAGMARNVSIHVRDLTDFEKNAVYSAADAFLFPCFAAKTAIEPPLTVLEAMASGAVVIVPDASSLREIVTNNKNGFLFMAEDHEAVADKLTRILVEEKLRTEVSQCARQSIVEKASPPIASARIMTLHNIVLGVQ